MKFVDLAHIEIKAERVTYGLLRRLTDFLDQSEGTNNKTEKIK